MKHLALPTSLCIAALAAVCSTPSPAAAEADAINVYGPGGPAPAMMEAAEVFGAARRVTATVLTVPAAAADGPAAHRHGSMPALPPAPFVASSAKPFAGLMDDAMSVMNAGMGSAPMTGDADHDFAGMMIPHHQGAVDMAKAQLLYGKNPVLRRLAQEIIVTQGSEIAVMRAELARGKDVRTARPADFSKP